jgi:hypothetical protein
MVRIGGIDIKSKRQDTRLRRGYPHAEPVLHPTVRSASQVNHWFVRTIPLFSLILMALIAGPDPVQGQSVPSALLRSGTIAPVRRIAVRADSRLWLEGSSNVRDWTCKATAMDATIDVGERNHTEASDILPVRGAVVRVPVRMLKCGDRHMEAHMYSALKSPENSPAGFIVAELEGLPVTDGITRTVEVTGHLTIAGVERPINIKVLGDKLPDGTLRARGTLPILMTDFGITPPRPWGGILRTANKVLIQFEIFVDPVQ